MKINRFFVRMCGLAPALALTLFISGNAQAAPLTGTVQTDPGTTVFPGFTSDDPGTLLDSMISTWSFVVPPPTGGSTSGELRSAVYRNTTGTLDFYYQVVNYAGSSTAIARESDANFSGFETYTGFRLDGSTLPSTIFDDGTVVPFTADKDGTGIVVGFNFGPLPGDRVGADMTSVVLVISTNATQYSIGNASIIDGGTATVEAFQPAAVPEPSTALLLCAGLVPLAIRLRRRNSNQ